jgi:hypothetical protein
MVFKFCAEILELRRHLPDTPEIEFHFNAPLAASVRISKNGWDGKEPADASSAVCLSTTEGEIEDEQCAADIRSALSTSLDGRSANLRAIQASRMPTVFASIDRFFHPLITLTESTVSILRWRYGLAEGPAEPFRRRSEHLSRDGKSWFEVSMARSATITFGIPSKQIEASPDFEQQIVGLVNERGEEPLAYRLFREAWNQKGVHPRSALVIGVAAAEVGFKRLIGTLVPKAQWLVDEIQTPSLGKMLRKYLPSLPIKGKLTGKKLSLPSDLIKKLEKAVEYRNKLVHSDQAPPDRKELEQMLRAVVDLLWICDLYAGRVWAADYLSDDTRAAWENE